MISDKAYLQKIAQQIKALATPFGEHAPVASPPNSLTTQDTPQALGLNPDVKKMQEAMHDLITKITPSTAVNLSSDTITKLKSLITPVQGKVQFRADGSWGPITDSALHSLLDFTTSLLALIHGLGLEASTNEIYNRSNLNDFKNDLSFYKIENNHINLTPEKQSEAAQAITEHLTAISKLYNYLLEHLPKINNEHILEPNEKAIVQKESVPIVINDKGYNVPLSVLTSPVNFDTYIQSLKSSDPNLKTEILNALINLPQQARTI